MIKIFLFKTANIKNNDKMYQVTAEVNIEENTFH